MLVHASESIPGAIVVTPSVLTWIWWTRVPDDRILYGAGVCLVISLFWGVHYAVLLRYLAPERSSREAERPKTDAWLRH